MSQIPTPPQSRGNSIEPDESKDKEKTSTTTLDEKVLLLDSLLERYLHLLDTHQKLQESLGKQLSSGFFQLAQANYVSRGRRFGEDFYDERMKATRRLHIASLPDNEQSDFERIDAQERVKFEVKYKSILEPEDDNKEEEEEKEKGTRKDVEEPAMETPPDETNRSNPDAQQRNEPAPGKATPPAQTTDITTSSDSNSDSATEKSTKKKNKKIFRSDDPISWYGILVPSSLKSAQKSFIEAVDDGVPKIISVTKEMRCVEDMVYELRKEIDGSVVSY